MGDLLTNTAYVATVRQILTHIGTSQKSQMQLIEAFPELNIPQYIRLGVRQGWLLRVNCCVATDSLVYMANANMLTINPATKTVVSAIPSFVPPKWNTAQYIPGVGYFDPTAA